jgi:hypothetical protein
MGAPPIEIPEPSLSAPWRAAVPLPHVAKVGGKRLVCNDRTQEVRRLNQSCAADWFVESRLLYGAFKIVLQQYLLPSGLMISPSAVIERSYELES